MCKNYAESLILVKIDVFAPTPVIITFGFGPNFCSCFFTIEKIKTFRSSNLNKFKMVSIAAIF